MAVLGSWAALNLAGGTAGALLAEDESWRSFHLANAAWNTVNGGLAVAGAVSLARREPASSSERAERARRFHRVLAINAGLDVGYIAAGGVLWGVGLRQDRPRLVGTGAALGLQGAWLLGFDLGLRARHKAVVDELALTPLGLRGRF
jgi:sulfite exporter TauE/SafE